MDAEALNRARKPLLSITILVLACSLGCSTPVGVARVDPRRVYRTLTSNVLSTGELSNPTRNVLYRRDLFERFEKNPQSAIRTLHAAVAEGRAGRDEIFALAELSFVHAGRSGKRRYFLASMVYAYAFLFPGGDHTPPDPLDPRLRLACDIYNRGITEGFAAADGKLVELRGGRFRLPFGTIDVAFDETQLRWADRRLVQLVAVADLEVKGDLLTFNRDALALDSVGHAATSVDNMTPGSSFIQTLASIPVAAGIPAHSIIAVRPGVPYEQGDDGIVEYQSAHLEGTESELVVSDSHSCQANPHTVEEVRRILLEHLGAE